MYTLYSMQRSGNCYKVRLALAQLDIEHNLVDIDILKGETRTPDFLAKNPNGQIPLLEIEPGRFLAESNAILWFLAENSHLVGDTALARARVLQWMFFEQHAIVPNIGAAYFWLCLIKGGRELQQHALDDWMEEGSRSLSVLDKHITRHPLLCRRPLYDRRRSALFLHASRRAERVRPEAVPGFARLAGACRSRAATCSDGLPTRAGWPSPPNKSEWTPIVND